MPPRERRKSEKYKKWKILYGDSKKREIQKLGWFSKIIVIRGVLKAFLHSDIL